MWTRSLPIYAVLFAQAFLPALSLPLRHDLVPLALSKQSSLASSGSPSQSLSSRDLVEALLEVSNIYTRTGGDPPAESSSSATPQSAGKVKLTPEQKRERKAAQTRVYDVKLKELAKIDKGEKGDKARKQIRERNDKQRDVARAQTADLNARLEAGDLEAFAKKELKKDYNRRKAKESYWRRKEAQAAAAASGATDNGPTGSSSNVGAGSSRATSTGNTGKQPAAPPAGTYLFLPPSIPGPTGPILAEESDNPQLASVTQQSQQSSRAAGGSGATQGQTASTSDVGAGGGGSRQQSTFTGPRGRRILNND